VAIAQQAVQEKQAEMPAIEEAWRTAQLATYRITFAHHAGAAAY
jgi:hypothetical protein